MSVLDQGLFSGVNFLLNVFLARWISPAEYGGFAVSYSIFLLFSAFQVAIIAEPMSIFGASRKGKGIRDYLDAMLQIQWVGSIIVSIFLIITAVFIQDKFISTAQIGMAVSLPFIFLCWYLRRASYLQSEVLKALFTSAVFAIFLTVIIFFLFLTRNISSVTAYIAIGTSSLIASILSLNNLGVHFWGSSKGISKSQYKAIIHEFWGFGKWILAAHVASWAVSMAYPLIIAGFLDLEHAGAFRAVQNLYLPLQQFLASITLLVLPWLARQRIARGESRVLETSRNIVFIAGVFSLVYCFLVVLFRQKIVNFLYVNLFYDSFVELIPYLAVASILNVIPLILGLSLRVLGKPDVILWSKGSSILFMLTAGLLLIWRFEMEGVILSVLFSALIEMLVLVFYYFRLGRLVSGSQNLNIPL